MKKILFLTLSLLMVVTLNVNAGKKNKKKVVEEPAKVEALVLSTATDSLSYASGINATKGLLNYLLRSAEMDTTYMADFVEGFREVFKANYDPKKLAYSTGHGIGMQVLRQVYPDTENKLTEAIDSISMNMFVEGFIAGITNDTTLFHANEGEKYMKERLEAAKKIKSAAYIEENTKWLEDNKQKEGVITLPSGLQYKVIEQGTGAVATVNDNVTVKYEGKTIDGTIFDSSYKRDPQTTTFRPNQVIKGWTEALCMMPEGSKWELYIPQELAYGERAAGKIKPYSTLIFTVEVVSVEK